MTVPFDRALTQTSDAEASVGESKFKVEHYSNNRSQEKREAVFEWFALRVRSNYERLAVVHLKDRGFDQFAPTYKTERQLSDRKKLVEALLFPGYVFCRLNPENRLPVLSIPGAVRLIGFGKGPTPIPENEIEAVRKMVGSGLLVGPWPFLSVGQSVRIERGPLTGVEGILKEVKKAFRLVVSIHLLQRSVSVELDRSWITPSSSTFQRPLARNSSGLLPSQ